MDYRRILGTALEPPIRTAHHELTVLAGAEPILSALFRDAESARSRILIETYIFRGDKLGTEFAASLARAAARGVAVRLLYDPFGSEETDQAFFEELSRRNIEVRAYRAGAETPLPGVPARDHSRVIVIDDAAYTGGAAWGDEWLPEALGGEGWHDVCARVKGPCVSDFGDLFEQRWAEARGTETTAMSLTTGDRYPDLELVGDSASGPSLIYERYRRRIRLATSRVWIENAYFFPPGDLLEDLNDAAGRGASVQILLPGRTDVPFLKRAARGELDEWLSKGIRVFESKEPMLHSKLALVDDDWCTLGTFNINPATMAFANEVNLFAFDPAVVARLAQVFEADRARSVEVTEEALRSRSALDEAMDGLATEALDVVDALIGPRGSSS